MRGYVKAGNEKGWGGRRASTGSVPVGRERRAADGRGDSSPIVVVQQCLGLPPSFVVVRQGVGFPSSVAVVVIVPW